MALKRKARTRTVEIRTSSRSRRVIHDAGKQLRYLGHPILTQSALDRLAGDLRRGNPQLSYRDSKELALKINNLLDHRYSESKIAILTTFFKKNGVDFSELTGVISLMRVYYASLRKDALPVVGVTRTEEAENLKRTRRFLSVLTKAKKEGLLD